MGKNKRIKEAKKNRTVPQPGAAAEQPSESSWSWFTPPSSASASASSSASASATALAGTFPRLPPHGPTGGPHLFTFLRQLQRSPATLPLSEQATLLSRCFALCNDSWGDSWKEEYKKAVPESVDVYGKIRDKEGFSNVLFEKPAGYYEPNALGGFMYSVDALAHVNDHLAEGAKKTPAEIAALLNDWFPFLFWGVFHFMMIKGVDLVALFEREGADADAEITISNIGFA